MKVQNKVSFVENDGGRLKAGFKGSTGDCVTRAIAIATGKNYKEVYNDLFDMMRNARGFKTGESPRNGVERKHYEKYLKSLGWEWVPTMTIGSGCKVHVKASELEQGRLILRLSKHLTAFIDGDLHDTYDCSRDGTRCVYGYFRKS